MTAEYNPAAISADELSAILARVDRYLRRHGSAYGETPIPADQLDDVRNDIILAWLADDWNAREFESLSRHGRSLFPPTLSTLGQHLRGVLFHAGRARRRGWRAEGATRRVAERRRDAAEFSGAGSASRSADPALILSAVESVSGELILSRRAAQNRTRRRLPLKYRGGVSVIPVDAPTAFKVMKRRNAGGYMLSVLARHPDRTAIQIERWTRFNFERVGQVSRRSPARAKTRRTLPPGIGSAECREAIG